MPRSRTRLTSNQGDGEQTDITAASTGLKHAAIFFTNVSSKEPPERIKLSVIEADLATLNILYEIARNYQIHASRERQNVGDQKDDNAVEGQYDGYKGQRDKRRDENKQSDALGAEDDQAVEDEGQCGGDGLSHADDAGVECEDANEDEDGIGREG